MWNHYRERVKNCDSLKYLGRVLIAHQQFYQQFPVPKTSTRLNCEPIRLVTPPKVGEVVNDSSAVLAEEKQKAIDLLHSLW